MRNLLGGSLMWLFIFTAALGFIYHAKQPIRAPIAGVTENISPEEYDARGGFNLEFSPEIASIGMDPDGQVYLEMLYLKRIWAKRVYLREGFCSGYDCMLSAQTALAYQLADGGSVRVKRFNLNWSLDGTYRNAGFWDLPYEK